MSKRAIIIVSVGGKDISSALHPLLIEARVSLKAGAHADTADIVLDDTGGQIVMPKTGDKITISLGWQGDGVRPVFDGVVDEPRSTGSRGGGRTLSISAKGFDATGKPKEGQRRHWDNATVKAILTDAGSAAGVAKISVDPDLAGHAIKYFAMVDESLLHMGQRLAKMIGGHFRVQGDQAVMARRDGEYSPSITAAFGDNLHGWSITPAVARGQYGTIRAPWYDQKAAVWKNVEVKTGLKSEAVHTIQPPCADEDDAKRQAKAAAATSKRDAGGGTINIEGNTGAVPDALCVLKGARPGIDGSYRITAVGHTYSRSAGFMTDLEVGHPQGGAGDDGR